MKKKLFTLMFALAAIATTAVAAEYNIWVGGVKVTDSNKTNITGSAIKKGKVMYEPSTKALVLTDVEIYRNEGDVIANTGVEGLVIIFEGTNRLTSNNNEDGAILLTKKTTISCSRNSKTNIYAEHHISTHMVKRAIYKPNANLTITGSGKLYIRSYGNGIEGKSYQNSSDVMTIKDAKVEIDTSDPALVDFSNITIEGNAKLTLNHRWDGTTSPRLYQVAKITLNDEQHICEPVGAVFSSTAKTIVLNNEPVSNKTIDINAEKIPLDNNSIVADANFRSYLKTTFANGKNHLMMCEAAKITRIDVNNKEISSLKGIECFTGLTTLFCYSNKLKELDVSKNTALTDLRCQDNQLTALDITKNTALKQLYCNTNKLTSLDVRFNTALTYLRCHDNQLSKLNVQTLPALTYLRCYRNKIGEWDMRNLVESLPKVSSGEGQFYVVYMDDSEENFIRPYVVNMAKEKGWKVFGFNGTDWKNYAGGILIKAKSDNASYGTVKGAGTYEKGATITLTATPNKGYKFVRWKVDDGSITTTVSGATATYSFTATEDVAYDEYIAVFEKDGSTDPKTLAVTFTKATTLASELSNEDKLVLAAVVVLAQKGKLDGYSVGIDPRDKGVVTLKKDKKTLFVSDNNKGITVPSGVTSADNINVTLTDDLRKALTTDLATQLASYAAIQIKFNISTPTGIEINATNFPDEKFRNFVKGDTIDTDRNGYLSDAEIAEVTVMAVFKGEIKDLTGIGFFTELTYLDCCYNQLTKLDMSKNTKLVKLFCFGNQIKGDAMQALVESLPDPSSPRVRNGAFVPIFTKNPYEGNVITKSQVTIAKNKHWRVYDYDPSNYTEYEGSDDTTGVGASLNDNGQMTNDSWYTIDGKKLNGEPTKKGVYIIKGKKVKK